MRTGDEMVCGSSEESMVAGAQSKEAMEATLMHLDLILNLYSPLFGEAPGKSFLVKIAWVDACRTSGMVS